MQTNRKTVNEQKEEYNSSRYSGLPSFPRSLSTLSVHAPPHHAHILHACSSTDQYLQLRPPGPWAAGATVSTLYRELQAFRGLHSSWTLSRDKWVNKYRRLAAIRLGSWSAVTQSPEFPSKIYLLRAFCLRPHQCWAFSLFLIYSLLYYWFPWDCFFGNYLQTHSHLRN